MPKINVYLPQWLAESVRDADIAISEICQRALTEAVGRQPPMSNTPKTDWWRHQSYEDRAKDLERGAAAVRYALAPNPSVPVIVKPIGAASALAAIRATDPSLLQWEHKAQDVTGWAAAVEVASELGAPTAVMALLEEKLAQAQAELDAVEVSSKLGPKQQVLDLCAELQERAHPRSPR